MGIVSSVTIPPHFLSRMTDNDRVLACLSLREVIYFSPAPETPTIAEVLYLFLSKIEVAMKQ